MPAGILTADVNERLLQNLRDNLDATIRSALMASPTFAPERLPNPIKPGALQKIAAAKPPDGHIWASRALLEDSKFCFEDWIIGEAGIRIGRVMHRFGIPASALASAKLISLPRDIETGIPPEDVQSFNVIAFVRIPPELPA
jgi:hypothetical protein